MNSLLENIAKQTIVSGMGGMCCQQLSTHSETALEIIKNLKGVFDLSLNESGLNEFKKLTCLTCLQNLELPKGSVELSLFGYKTPYQIKGESDTWLTLFKLEDKQGEVFDAELMVKFEPSELEAVSYHAYSGQLNMVFDVSQEIRDGVLNDYNQIVF